MLKYRKVDSDNLSDQFGFTKKSFEDAGELWKKVQDIIVDDMKSAMKPHKSEDGKEGIEYDARQSMEIFFKHFNTQELQDIALIQLVMRDLGNKGEHVAMEMAKEAMKGMMERLSKGNTEDIDVDFEDLL